MKSIDISFSPSEISEYKSFFSEHGFVVIRSVLFPADIHSSVEELWQSPNFLNVPGLDRADPGTWESNWPFQESSKEGRGFVQSLNGYDEVCAWRNRQNPEVVKVFQNLLGKEELWVVFDRFNIMRPTKGLRIGGEIVDKPNWKTSSAWLHWDQNPWREPDFCRAQGMLSFTKQTLTSGGFCCVPGFNHRFTRWAEDNPVSNFPHLTWEKPLIYVPRDDPIQNEKVAILMDPGSLLVWDSRLPHQNYPNDDNTWRMIQYIRFKPVDKATEAEVKQQVREKISIGLTGENFPRQLSPLGRKLTGLVLWHEEDDQEFTEPIQLSQGETEALNHFVRAQKLEMDGKLEECVVAYKKAFRMNPLLENFTEPF